jgi:hypothetical protein
VTSGLRYRVEYEYVDETGQTVHAIEADEFLVKTLLTNPPSTFPLHCGDADTED